MREPLRVIVVDDEPLARRHLVDLLRQDIDFEEPIECENGLQAVEAIRQGRVDLVLLDVQMPELDGLQVVETIGAAAMPATIFVTAYDQHAIRAFESSAVDYVLKPFSDERLEAALVRVKARLAEREHGDFGRQMMRLLGQRPAGPATLARLLVKTSQGTRIVRADEIDLIEGAGAYVTLHIGTESLLHRASLLEMAQTLDPARFVRIHRSSMVNIERIDHLKPLSHGEFEVFLKSGRHARVSRTCRCALEERLGPLA